MVFNRATSSEESPAEVDVDPPWRILSNQLGLSHKDDDLQEVKGRVCDERGANSARRNIAGSGLRVPSACCIPDTDAG